MAERDHRLVEHHKTAPSLLFPTYVPLLNNPSYKDLNNPLSGTSDPNVAFTGRGLDISPDRVAAVHDRGAQRGVDRLRRRANGKETLQAAFTSFQNVLVSYAKAQGFTVST